MRTSLHFLRRDKGVTRCMVRPYVAMMTVGVAFAAAHVVEGKLQERGWRDGRDRQGSERATRCARPECVCRGGQAVGKIEDLILTKKDVAYAIASYFLACLISSLTRSSETRRHTRCQSFLVMCVAASQSFKHCASHSAPRLRISSGALASMAWGVAACADGVGLFRIA